MVSIFVCQVCLTVCSNGASSASYFGSRASSWESAFCAAANPLLRTILVVIIACAMAEERVAKLRRLDAFRRRVPAVSASALEAICTDIEQHDLPDTFDRKSITDAKNLITSSDTRFGPIHQHVTLKTHGGDDLRLEVVHPFAMLVWVFAACSPWRALLLQRHEKQPSSPERPWSLALYTDEATPGNVLALMPTRKAWAIYFSFLKLGHAALCREDAWFCLSVIRSSEIKRVLGGIA